MKCRNSNLSFGCSLLLVLSISSMQSASRLLKLLGRRRDIPRRNSADNRRHSNGVAELTRRNRLVVCLFFARFLRLSDATSLIMCLLINSRRLVDIFTLDFHCWRLCKSSRWQYKQTGSSLVPCYKTDLYMTCAKTRGNVRIHETCLNNATE